MRVAVPGAWTFALLALASWRLTRLAGWDVITRPLREPLTRRKETGSAKNARDASEGTRRRGYRPRLDQFIHCPFCQGFWTSSAVWGAWVAWPHPTVFLAVPFALSAVVGLTTKNLDL